MRSEAPPPSHRAEFLVHVTGPKGRPTALLEFNLLGGTQKGVYFEVAENPKRKFRLRCFQEKDYLSWLLYFLL